MLKKKILKKKKRHATEHPQGFLAPVQKEK